MSRFPLAQYIDHPENRADVGTPFFRWLVAAFAAHSDAWLVVEDGTEFTLGDTGDITLVRDEADTATNEPLGVFLPSDDDGWIGDPVSGWISDMPDE